MKTTITVAVLVLLALWLGYWQGHTHGYQQGLEAERSAWLGTLRTDTNGVMTYSNPHTPLVDPDSLGIQVETAPDPRSLPVK